MKKKKMTIGGIPAIVWGEQSERVWLCVHGKMSNKESAEGVAQIAAQNGYQTISFDLPQHGEREKEIGTPIDLLSWNYYQYVLQHPITCWNSPTNILFGGRDNLQTLDIIRSFAERNGCTVTFSGQSEHPFMSEEDVKIVMNWLNDNI